MIQVQIVEHGVERVLFVSTSDSEEDHDLLCWRKIRELVDRIDKELREQGGEPEPKRAA